MGYWLFLRPSIYAPDTLSMTVGIVGAIVGMLALFLLVQVLLEGPSYATYVIKKRSYFHHMKVAIADSPDYQSFYGDFYSNAKRKLTKPSGAGIDRLLTDIFYRIDQYWWIIFLIGAALFFCRKWFFQG